MNIQFKKGALELCVLALLSRKDCYGYEMAEALERALAVAEGTVYPLLKRLKDEGYVTTYLVESQEGPPRKYYAISRQGQTRYKDLSADWKEFKTAVDTLMEQDND